MFCFKKSFSKKCAILFCLLFLISTVMTAYAGAAGGGGGGGGSLSGSSSGGGGGGSSRGSSSGGGGGSSSGGASGGGGSSSSSSSGSSSGSSSIGRSSGGGGSSIIANAVGGGGTGLDNEISITEDSDIGYEIIDSNGHGSGSSVIVNRSSSTSENRGSPTSVNRGSSASGGGSGQDDMSSLSGYVPTTTASANSGSSNMSGVMVTNGVDNKFVVTSKDGQQTSEYLKDWAVLTTPSGSQGWYHFDNNGNMSTGFINDSAGNTYYMMESGENKGMMAVGTININGTNYTFSNGSDGRTYGALVK